MTSTAFGLTDDGWIPRSYEDITEGIAQRLRGRYGPNAASDPESVEGVAIAVVGELATQLWEAGTDIYASQDPDSNTGQAQDQVCAITGTFRDPARKSVVTETFIGDVGTDVDVDTGVTSEGVAPPVFAVKTLGTIAAADAWQTSHAYAVGAFVKNDGDADGTFSIYYCITAGVSAASIGPGGDNLDITDGTAHWRWIGDGAGFVQLVCACTVTGPVGAATYSLTVPANSIAGVNNVINLEDAQPGSNVMNDTALRIFREEELAKPGTGTYDAMTADLFEVGPVDNPVLSVHIFNNVEDFAVDGVPPHCFEALIEGGDDQLVRDAILKNRPLGIGTAGTVFGTAVDSEGGVNVIKFSRPETKDISISVSLTRNPKTYPTNGDELVKQAIFDWGFFLQAGYDVEPTVVLSQFIKAVPGVLRCDLPFLAISPTPPTTATAIVINDRQRAKFNTARISVVSVDGTP